jgi:hypothetical protein
MSQLLNQRPSCVADRDIHGHFVCRLCGVGYNDAVVMGDHLVKAHGAPQTVRTAGIKGGTVVARERGREHYERIGKKGGAEVKRLVTIGKAVEAVEQSYAVPGCVCCGRPVVPGTKRCAGCPTCCYSIKLFNSTCGRTLAAPSAVAGGRR